jgi:hypothetical protein
MKRLMILLIASTMGATLIGCGATTKEITRMSHSERTDVFTEVPAEGAAPAGFVDVVIKASLKTPLEGYYALEPTGSAHGKPGYPFLLNIDGQAVLWKVDGQKETVPLYDGKGKASHDPDAGAGMKYTLEKKIGLAAGPHTIFFGLPEEPYFTEVKISLKEGMPQVLEFKPHYRYKTRPTRIPSFLEGIDSYETLLDGQIVRRE